MTTNSISLRMAAAAFLFMLTAATAARPSTPARGLPLTAGITIRTGRSMPPTAGSMPLTGLTTVPGITPPPKRGPTATCTAWTATCTPLTAIFTAQTALTITECLTDAASAAVGLSCRHQGKTMNHQTRFTAQPLEEPSDAENAPQPPAAAPASRRTQLLRLAGSWLGFSGLYAVTGGTCPFCGQSACPAGLLGAGVVGGVLALGLQAWKWLQK